jgi:hypothetical protein
MVKSQILNERPFDIDDGERYLIVVVGDNKQYSVFTRKFQSKPVTSIEFREAKIYKELKAVQKVAQEVFSGNDIYQNSVIKIFRVKDIFEPRYFVQYKKRPFMGVPDLKCYTDWYVKGENQVDTYIDYNEAQAALEKYKRDLVEFYYSQILDLKNLVLTKI